MLDSYCFILYLYSEHGKRVNTGKKAITVVIVKTTIL
jgi:hypothetical protein